MGLKSISKAFNGSFTGLPRKLQGHFMDVSKVFWESFKEASKKFQGCFNFRFFLSFSKKFLKGVSIVLMDITKVFRGSFNFFRNFHTCFD